MHCHSESCAVLLCACVCARYGGSWRLGKKHGIGTYYFVSGAKYQGEYKEGEPHGQAKFIEKDGKAYEEVSGEVERQPPGAHSHIHSALHTHTVPFVCVCVYTRSTLTMPFTL